MNGVEKAYHCPVVWLCSALGYKIIVSPDAVYDITNGWICDCGKRVIGEDLVHKNVIWGLRDGIRL